MQGLRCARDLNVGVLISHGRELFRVAEHAPADGGKLDILGFPKGVGEGKDAFDRVHVR